MKFILASGSPRRRELLTDLGLKFQVCPSGADESIDEGLTFGEACEGLSVLKAEDVFKTFKNEAEVCVIGADTIVVADNTILGKPKNEADAFNMLKTLQNRSHLVYTGTAVIIKKEEEIKRISCFDKTEVFMVKLTDKQIDAYIKSGEPMDKAGSYAIQGRGAVFIDKIIGNYQTVVGLNISLLYKILKDNELITDF